MTKGITIKRAYDGAVLYEAPDAVTIKEAVEAAVFDGANLNGARLNGASLIGARLIDASLIGASLDGARLSEDTQLPTGEKWGEYLRETLPALFTAGGRTLGEVATEEHWSCHNWSNCPMHAAFGAEGISDVPILLRPRVEQFIQLFDARLIPLDAVSKIEDKS